MKLRRFLLVSILLVSGLQAASVQAMRNQALHYTYYDADGLAVGEKYTSCDNHTSQVGTETSNYDIEYFPCGIPLPPLPFCEDAGMMDACYR